MENVEYKDLGWANSWYAHKVLKDGEWVKAFEDRVPEEVVKCRAAGHKMQSANRGRCLNRYFCPICKISYMVDSSD